MRYSALFLFVALSLAGRADDAVPAPAQDLPVQVTKVLPNGLLCLKLVGHERLVQQGGTYNSATDYQNTGVYVFVQTKPDGFTEGQRKVFYAIRAGTYANGENNIEKWIAQDRPVPPPPVKPAP